MAIVADLGIDRLVSYRIGPDGSLTRLAEQALAPGAGPRHVALHPGGRFVFVMNELDSTIVSLALDDVPGRLSVIDTKPAVPAAAARRQSLRRHPDLARRPLPLWFQPRPCQRCGVFG
ncbi:lactonase family protein [Mesorhizobium sp. BHbsci]